MVINSNDPAAQRLLELLHNEFGVPRSLYSLTLTLKVQHPITIEVGFYPQKMGEVDGGEGSNAE